MDNKELIIIDIKELDSLFQKYFKTLEVQDLELKEKINLQEEHEIKLQEEHEMKLQEQKDLFTTDVEFRSYVLEKLDLNNTNIQYTNNLLYWSIVVTGTILISCLLYRFLKIFF